MVLLSHEPRLRKAAIVAAPPAPMAAYSVLFGAEYAVFLRLRPDAVDSRAPLVAAGLLLAAELAFGAVAAEGGRYERSLVAAEALMLLGAAFATILAGGVLLVIAGTVNAGVALEAVGAFAAVCAVGLLARLARGWVS